MRATSIRAAVATLVVFTTGVVVTALVLIPWQPVPGGMPAASSPESIFSTAQIAIAERYAWWARVWSWGGLLTSLVAFVAIATPRGRRLVARLPGPRWLRVSGAVALVETLITVVGLPWAAAQHVHRLDAGLSRQPWVDFAADQLKGLGVTIVAASLGLIVLTGIARRLPRSSPLVVAPLLATLVLVGSYVYPVLVEPLFNHFTPLPDSTLRSRILTLADREGVRVDDVLVADASRRTTTLNAYVSGFGDTRRVVLYDTLVDDQPPDQVVSVVAHELAHAKHDDVLVGSLLGALGTGAGVGLLGLVLAWGARRRAWPGAGEPAVVPVVLALMAIGSVASAPAVNSVSRAIETRADVDALTADPDAASFIELQRQLALRARSDPTPPALLQFWFGSHPTVLQRTAIAQQFADGQG